MYEMEPYKTIHGSAEASYEIQKSRFITHVLHVETEEEARAFVQKIKKQYPAEYKYLLQNVYPGLRRSDYEISFNFSDFTLEQSKEIYKKKPYQLSLREMWDVAQTLEPNSPEYNRMMQTAVNIYPDDPQALVNLANVAIRQKDLLKAESLLERAGDSAEALNSRAVIAIIQKRYDDAERLLQQAAAKGLDVSKNLDAISILK